MANKAFKREPRSAASLRRFGGVGPPVINGSLQCMPNGVRACLFVVAELLDDSRRIPGDDHARGDVLTHHRSGAYD